jgi:SAM-dependent MidA family methyltransferase
MPSIDRFSFWISISRSIVYFSGYMESWLYGTEGYYTRFKAIGKQGDFYTAVSVSPFFGASIANFLYHQIEAGSIPRNALLVEVGAHQGHLIGDMIQWLYTCDPRLIDEMRFAVIEREPKVREAQRHYFEERFGQEVEIEQYEGLEGLREPYAFVFANEIFDAFPCELINEGAIATLKQDHIVWQKAPQALLEQSEKYRQTRGEFAVGYEAFAKRMSVAFEDCDFVTFDYGEQYVRNDFSIRLYTQHETFPLFDESVVLSEHYRLSDLTYDVNFEHVMDAFGAAGFKKIAYETQARALVRFGIIEMLDAFARQTTQANYLREADKIKTLLAPTMMGDRFKMLHLRKSSHQKDNDYAVS